MIETSPVLMKELFGATSSKVQLDLMMMESHVIAVEIYGRNDRKIYLGWWREHKDDARLVKDQKAMHETDRELKEFE